MLKHDHAFYERAVSTNAALFPKLEQIAALTDDNPAEQARVEQLRTLISRQTELTNRSLETTRAGGVVVSIRMFRTDGSIETLTEIRRIARDMAEAERRLLEERNTLQSRTVQALVGVLVAAGVILIVTAAFSVVVIVRYTRDLSRSRDQLRRLNENLEDIVRERTADLARANDEIQRFAYIVSHDLRSPLVNIMGFTSELEAALPPLRDMIAAGEAASPPVATPAAHAAVEADLPEAIAFIRKSTQKMDRLINAILRLSREGRRILTPERLAMGAIVAGVADTLKHRADEIGAEITVEGELPSIVSDRLAMEQVFSNLIENALKYLKPGRPGRIVVRGHAEPGRLVYEIEDNGRGVDPKDHQRIFELFRRSGPQDQPGEGIGLAHVRALIYRLGGVIACDSALDRGAIFRLFLPPTLAGDQGSSL